MIRRSIQVIALAATFILASALPADAGQRRFTYVYEVTTAPAGTFEFENWVTWKRGHADGGTANQFNFRHELEYGVTDRFQLALYIADWGYTSAPGEHRAEYQHSGVEAIYNLTNPVTDFLGSAIYGEVLVGEALVELEGKLLLQKNFGPWIVAYNLTLEAEWEGDRFGNLDEQTGELAQSFGVSYQLNAHFTAGAELVQEWALPDWRASGKTAVFAGPNVSFRSGRFFATATALFRVTDNPGEPNIQPRLIVGFDF